MPFDPDRWKITVGGVTKKPSDYGINGLSLKLVSQAPDELEVRMQGTAMDAPEVMPFDSLVTLTDQTAGTIIFQGYAAKPTRDGQGTKEALGYTVLGPWYLMEDTPYKQSWDVYDLNFLTGQALRTTVYTSHVFYNIINGLLVFTSDFITAVLNYFLAQFPAGSKPFQIGEILSGTITTIARVKPPMKEDRDVTVAQVIQNQLKYTPDAVVYFDYSVTPPRLHIHTRNQLRANNLDFGPATPLSYRGFRYSPRYDLQRPCVEITYETTSSVDGQEKRATRIDRWPTNATGRARGTMAVTVQLMGPKITTAKAETETALLADATSLVDATRLAWWRRHVPELFGADITGLVIDPTKVTFTDSLGATVATPLPYELTNGVVPVWAKIGNTSVAVQELVVTAKVKYKKMAGAVEIRDATEDIKPVRIQTVSVPGQTFETTATVEDGDPQPPQGLAKYFYDTFNVLHHEGSITIDEEEITQVVKMGQVLRFFGLAQTDLRTADAAVQSVSYDLNNGVTTVTFGPPQHLGVQDLVELMKVGRLRRNWTNPLVQSDPSSDSSDVEFGKTTPKQNTTSNHGLAAYEIVSAAAGTVTQDGRVGVLSVVAPSGTQGVSMSIAACVGGGQPRLLTVREVNVCEQVGTPPVDTIRKKLFVCSDTYD